MRGELVQESSSFFLAQHSSSREQNSRTAEPLTFILGAAKILEFLTKLKHKSIGQFRVLSL